MKPSQSQSPERAEWEEEVIYELELLSGMTTSDAQGTAETVLDLMDDCFTDGESPKQTAKKIYQATTIKVHNESDPEQKYWAGHTAYLERNRSLDDDGSDDWDY